ncbi:MAG TPA: hypothetical protein VM537_18285 [Anaerolineae bacterium]|nr:hypothetical protein [Anaerolineae bacterium]
MAPVIYDADGTQRDMTWLRQIYGNVQFLEAEAGPKFALTRVDETRGTALIKVRVLEGSGQAVQGQPVANRWPDPSLPDLRGSGSQTLWHDRAHVQNTDSNGLTGFGLGSGSYIGDLNVGGPHTLWVLSPAYYSDGLSGVGMLGGTNHDGPLSLTFQIQDEDTPPPPPPSSDAVMERLDEVMERLERIQGDLRQIKRHFGAG